MKKVLRKAVLILLFAVTIYSLGVVSSTVSKRACENYLAYCISHGFFKDKAFRVPDDPETLEIFDRLGARYVIRKPERNDPLRYRHGYVKQARYEGPFLVSVEAGVMVARLCGTGWRVRFFCFFGFVFQLDEDVVWNS
jgi:hypothetical protein